ncbi:hypothetical protein BDN71DRAFT_1446803 [Pleurotus eryngii]|uniref:Uncharacterized protein n=1 Tax=Pleurotus eryngii TaxID=5323 RepID=A0A9P6DH70_PLEER|nr:hypothetical protein BDN71DRAFT_1446803 [Pleurotus eryngii]
MASRMDPPVELLDHIAVPPDNPDKRFETWLYEPSTTDQSVWINSTLPHNSSTGWRVNVTGFHTFALSTSLSKDTRPHRLRKPQCTMKLAIAIAHVPTLRLYECYYEVSMNECLDQEIMSRLKALFYEDALDMSMALILKFIERHPLLEQLTIRNEI